MVTAVWSILSGRGHRCRREAIYFSVGTREDLVEKAVMYELGTTWVSISLLNPPCSLFSAQCFKVWLQVNEMSRS